MAWPIVDTQHTHTHTERNTFLHNHHRHYSIGMMAPTKPRSRLMLQHIFCSQVLLCRINLFFLIMILLHNNFISIWVVFHIKVLTSMMTRPTGWLSATMSKNTRGRPIFSVFLLAKFRTLRCTNDDWIRIGGDEFANRATAAVDRLNSSVAEAILDWIVCEVNWARARQRGQNDGGNLVVE